MALVECPTQNSLPSYQYVIPLDGSTYTLTFTWNPRINDGQGKWFLDLGDGNGNEIVNQVPIVAGWPLFDRFNELPIPPGTLFCFDSSGQNMDPGQFDLGSNSRCQIFYATAGTL